jgi:hypothetical protein
VRLTTSSRKDGHFTGPPLNGPPGRSRKPTVRSDAFLLQKIFIPSDVDIAAKLNLIAPIAEQCQHKCAVSLLMLVLHTNQGHFSMFHRERPEKEYA